MNFFDAKLEKNGDQYVVRCQGAVITPGEKIRPVWKARNVRFHGRPPWACVPSTSPCVSEPCTETSVKA